MARLAAGDLRALEELYDRHAPVVFGMLSHLIPDRRDREELLQETFLAVWRHAGAYDGRRGSVSSWLLTIAHRKAIDLLRSRRARPPELPLNPAPRTAPGASSDGWVAPEPAAGDDTDREVREAVVQAIGGLTPEQRDVVILAYFFGYSCTEIAAIRRIPVGTVKSRMQRALTRLRRLLAQRGAGE